MLAFTPTHLRAEIGRSYSKSLTPPPKTSVPKLRDVGTCKSVTQDLQLRDVPSRALDYGVWQ